MCASAFYCIKNTKVKALTCSSILVTQSFCISYLNQGFLAAWDYYYIPLIKKIILKNPNPETYWTEIKHFYLNNPCVFRSTGLKKWNMNADLLFLNHAVLKVARRKRKEWSKKTQQHDLRTKANFALTLQSSEGLHHSLHLIWA